MLQTAFGASCINQASVFEWHKRFKEGRESLANQLWCIDFLTPFTPLIIPHRLPAFLESLMPLKN